MKFSWLSNSMWTPSGYGQQSRIFIPRLAALGHEIGVICFYGLEGGVLALGKGITCFPKRYHPYGNDVSAAHSAAFGAQFMISLMDTWVMNPEEYPIQLKWIPWVPVDSDPMPAIVRGKINSALARIAMSKFGESQIHAAGMDCWYIPLGVETQVMTPKDKKAAREKLNIPPDAWVVGTVAMNKGLPSRKNFAEMLTAFAHCKKRHPDWFYWLQSERGDVGGDMVNLPELCRNLGLEEGKDYMFCDQYQNVLGFPPEYFADLYSAFDVHCLVSAGEGFGIPILEAQACGCPVIVGDWTASGELCLAGHKVDKKDSIPFYTGLATYQFIPRIGAIEDALEEEYRNRTDTTQALELVRATYDADVIVQQHWIPTLAKIEAAVNKEWQT